MGTKGTNNSGSFGELYLEGQDEVNTNQEVHQDEESSGVNSVGAFLDREEAIRAAIEEIIKDPTNPETIMRFHDPDGGLDLSEDGLFGEFARIQMDALENKAAMDSRQHAERVIALLREKDTPSA